MTKLITAEEARSMQENSVKEFMDKDMIKVIKHLNKRITEETSKGNSGFDFCYRYHPDINYDEVFEKLSERQIKEVVNYLKDNGYKAFTYSIAFYVSWDKEEPVIDNSDVHNKPWYSFWRKS